MNIKFLLPKARGFVLGGRQPKRASQRFRGLVPLKHMTEADGFIDSVKESTTDDLVIVAKAASPEDILYLKDKGIKFVFDICDNKWRVGKDHKRNTEIMNTGCKYANLITTTCGELQQKIYEESGKKAHIIDDPYERDIEEPKFNPGDHLNICYFGGRKSFSLVDWEEAIAVLNHLKINYTLHCITQKHEMASKRLTHHYYPKGRLKMYEWNYDLQAKLVRESDFVLMPVPSNNFVVKHKSPNRVLDSIAQGRYIITTSGVNSYHNYTDYIGIGSLKENIKWALDNPKSVISKIEKGQDYIKKHHSPQVIAKAWMSLRKQV